MQVLCNPIMANCLNLFFLITFFNRIATFKKYSLVLSWKLNTGGPRSIAAPFKIILALESFFNQDSNCIPKISFKVPYYNYKEVQCASLSVNEERRLSSLLKYLCSYTMNFEFYSVECFSILMLVYSHTL